MSVKNGKMPFPSPSNKPPSEWRSKFMSEFEEVKNKRRKAQSTRRIKFVASLIILFSLYYLPFLLGRKMTCAEYKKARIYEKMYYYMHPLMSGPCDTTSPFGIPKSTE